MSEISRRKEYRLHGDYTSPEAKSRTGGVLCRRELFRRAKLFGLGTALGLPLSVARDPSSAWATVGYGEAITKVSEFIGANGNTTYEDAISDAVAHSVVHSNGVVDFEGISYVTTATVSIYADGITFTNGGIRPVGQFPALSVQANDVTVQGMVFSRSTDADLMAATPDRCCVIVAGKRFRSFECSYLGANASCLYLANGRCGGALIKGGEMTTGSARQNGSGVYAADGAAGNRNVTIDGVHIHDATMGILLLDASDCTVINCRAERLRVLPTIALTGWTKVADDVWRSRAATGVPGVDGVPVDRDSGSTNVISVNGTQLGAVLSGSHPAANAASQSDGYVYINLAGDDPNEQSITSGIVSGYAFTIYSRETTCERNRFIDNYAEDCDGFGIYFQLGMNNDGIGSNQAIGNTLKGVCKAGRQSLSLPFAAIGVAGGSDTLLEGNTIDGVGSLMEDAPGIHVIPSPLFPAISGAGRIIKTTVKNGSQNGFLINSSAWQLTDCHADHNAKSGFLILAIAKDAIVERVLLDNCTASRNGGDGFSVDGGNSAIRYVSVEIIGGESSYNALSGVVFYSSTNGTVRNSVLTGMVLNDNAVVQNERPQIWVRPGCVRTSISNCSIAASTPSAVGLLVDGDAVETVIDSNYFALHCSGCEPHIP